MPHRRRTSQEPEYLSGPPHSVAVALCATPARLTETRLREKLLRKKKNESWAMRASKNSRPNKSDSRSWRKLVMQNRSVWFFAGRDPRLRACRSVVAQDADADSFAGVKRRWSQSSSQRRVSIFRSINRPQASSVISVGRHRAKTNPTRERCLREVPGLVRGADRERRPVDLGVHARIAQRAHAGFARRHSDQSGLAGRIQFRRPHHGRYRPDRGRARAAKHNLRTARACRRDSNLHETRHRNAGRDGGRAKADRTTPFANGRRATAKSTSSIIRSA